MRTTGTLTKQACNGAENKMVDVYYPYCPLGGVVLTGLVALQISVPCLLKLHIPVWYIKIKFSKGHFDSGKHCQKKY